MAPLGRPSKPIEVKRRTGNPGKRPLPPRRTTIALPSAAGHPAPITLGPDGRELWQRAQEGAGWLSDVDLVALEDLALTWDEVCAMRRAIAEDGLSPHPLHGALRNAQKQLHATAAALGFDPSSRAYLLT